jgi:hypothetical protein
MIEIKAKWKSFSVNYHLASLPGSPKKINPVDIFHELVTASGFATDVLLDDNYLIGRSPMFDKLDLDELKRRIWDFAEDLQRIDEQNEDIREETEVLSVSHGDGSETLFVNGQFIMSKQEDYGEESDDVGLRIADALGVNLTIVASDTPTKGEWDWYDFYKLIQEKKK